MKKIFGILTALTMLWCLVVAVFAVPAEDTVFVAGCPDRYPIEYYDEKCDAYCGVLPDLLSRIGEETGLSFVYLNGGGRDRRAAMAVNKQADVVSAYVMDDTAFSECELQGAVFVLTAENEGIMEKIGFAFTSSMPEELRTVMSDALAEIEAESITTLSLQYAGKEDSRNPLWTYLICAAVLLLAAVFLIIYLQRRKQRSLDTVKNMTDPLTGLGNTVYLSDFIKNKLPEDYMGQYSLIYFGFEIVKVNKYYGEDAAEEQLAFAADVLRAVAENGVAMARVSGGGIAVLRLCVNKNEVERWTRDVLDKLNTFCDRYGNDYLPVFQAGVYLFTDAKQDYYSLVFNARVAYDNALDSLKPIEFGDDIISEEEREKIELKKRISKAIENEEFKLYVQFVVDTKSGKIVGGEGLSRWSHPEKGLIKPERYIPLLEEENTISTLDFYMFEQICRMLEDWERTGRNFHMNCNFSRSTIERFRFVERIREIAGKYDFQHEKLVMEITEDLVGRQRQLARDNIMACRAMGYQIALDDMGSGSASFHDLADFPVDIVKIDRSILLDAATPRGKVLLDTMIQFGHKLDKTIICEGIETREQAEMLREMNCDYLQGFLYYRPLPQGEAERLLAEQG